MYNNYPNRSVFPAFYPLLVGATTAVAVSLAATGEDPVTYQAKDVKHIQEYNEQLRPQLEVGSRVVAHLVLDGDKKSFSFTTQDNGAEQTCTGEYTVQKNSAQLQGNLACTQVVKVGN